MIGFLSFVGENRSENVSGGKYNNGFRKQRMALLAYWKRLYPKIIVPRH